MKQWAKFTLAVALSPVGLWRLVQGSWLGVLYPSIWMSTLFSFSYEGARHVWGVWVAGPILLILSVIDIRSSMTSVQVRSVVNIPARMGFVILGVLLQWAVLVFVMVVAMALGLIAFPHSMR